jgi:hypothetical protein
MVLELKRHKSGDFFRVFIIENIILPEKAKMG